MLEFVDQPEPEDAAFESDGVTVFVDSKSLVYLDGTIVDYAREGLNEGPEFRTPMLPGSAAAAKVSRSDRERQSARRPATTFRYSTSSQACLSMRLHSSVRITRCYLNFTLIATLASQPQSSGWLAQFCADVNSGYRTLLNEVTRAEYLLKSAGVDLQAAEREGVGADFLMMQIMLRERLEDTPRATR